MIVPSVRCARRAPGSPVRRLVPLLLLLLLAAGACAAAPPPRPLGPTLDGLARPDHVTVVTFFGSSCPCQRAHDPRLLALHERYHARGVDFVAVDAEADADPTRDAEEAHRRGYPFSIVSDPEGRFADALGAEYATYSVVLDRRGRVRYRGGIDRDKAHLTPDATPWLDHAIESVLAGREPDPAEAKTLGCALRRR